MDKSLKRQIVNAAEAVKKKVRKIRNFEIDSKRALDTVLRPVTEPLNLIAKASKQTTPLNAIEHEVSQVPFIDETMQKEGPDRDEDESEINSDSSYESIVDQNQDCDTSSWSVSSEALRDVPFGVRVERDKLMLGSAPITISDQFIIVAGHKYKNTVGLNQLLLKKDPDLSLVSENDKQNYKLMLLNTNAHRRDYDPNKAIKSNKGKKYMDVIKPLFQLRNDCTDKINLPKGKGLLMLKKLNKDVDYIYWDDPNELVERLKLLMASQNAGNTGVDNEIISIIEELREGKFIS